jgi:hypothetical protein
MHSKSNPDEILPTKAYNADNVSDKETHGGDSKHHVHGGESSQPDFKK